MGTEQERAARIEKGEEAIAAELEEKKDIEERIESLELTMQVLDDVDEGRGEALMNVRRKLKALQERLQGVNFVIDSTRKTVSGNTPMKKKRRHAVVVMRDVEETKGKDGQELLSGEENSDGAGDAAVAAADGGGDGGDMSERDGGDDEDRSSTMSSRMGSADAGKTISSRDMSITGRLSTGLGAALGSQSISRQDRSPQALPPLKVILPPTHVVHSKSGLLQFHRSEAPYFTHKTITATLKSYTSGEHIIIAILEPSEDLESSQDDPVIIKLSGFTGLRTRDADFIPVLGGGGRLCLNGGGVWRQTPGELKVQLAHGMVLTADAQHTFRFVLHVDPKTQHKPVCPTVAISGAYDVPAVSMVGEVLGFTPSAASRHKTAKHAASLQNPDLFDQTPMEQQDLRTKAGSTQEGAQVMVQDEQDDVDAEGGRAASADATTSDFQDWGCDLETGHFGKQLYHSDKGLFNVWRPRHAKVYVCTAFHDMKVEREELDQRIMPRLVQLGQTQLMTLTIVDMRLGSKADDRREGTIKLCLDEADRCHYFACFLGEVSSVFVSLSGTLRGWFPTSKTQN